MIDVLLALEDLSDNNFLSVKFSLFFTVQALHIIMP